MYMRKLIVLLTVLALIPIGATAAVGAVGAADGENGSQKASGERDARPAPLTLTTCDGGAQLAIVTNLQDAPATVGEGALVALPSSFVPTSATTNNDTITVTLIGEAEMNGVAGNDRIEVEARLDGVAMEPTPGPVGFHTGSGQDSNAARWCSRRVPAGTHTVQIFWHTVDVAPVGTVTGTLDDYSVQVQRND
jgi:hypothetical protein